MKKILLFVVCIWGFTFYAQNQQSKNQLFLGAGAKHTAEHSTNLNVSMQVGGVLLFNTSNSASKTTVAFPYSILYIPDTFVADKLIVSKGLYADVVKINWEIGANENLITNIQIFRKEVGSATPERLIATVGKAVFEYEDTQTETGKLYEYKIRANGVGTTEKEFFNFVQGIGFRNPTATVTGSISYEGGNPVKDVTVFAEAVGAESTSIGRSMFFNNSYASTGRLKTPIKATSLTLQAWISFKLTNGKPNIFSFTTNKGNNYKIISKINQRERYEAEIRHNGIIVSVLHLENSIPTGEIDAFGNDIYRNMNVIFEDEFIHFSMILENGEKPIVFINGRKVTTESISGIKPPGIIPPKVTRDIFSTYNVDSDESLQQVDFCTNCDGNYLDEIRIWDKVLSEEEIRRDYRRYLDGGEKNLKLYLRADEGVGNFMYDLSRVGFIQNENHASLIRGNGTLNFSTNIPERKQLGVFGVTDKNGSYLISAIPYVGNGETFEITPSLGVHQFNPASQTLFLGKDEPVVNKVDFTDISSFNFNGKVVYNVQDVFNPIETSQPTNLRDSENYNQYLLGNTLINKGEYYYEGGSINASTGLYTGGILKRYPIIPVEGANILIDGNLVFDSDNQPVVTNAEGTFKIDVPIGNHRIEVRKDGHTFELNGRFPASGTHTFFEDQIETRYFINNTRVSLVGKVVGGKKEFDKPVGFGFNGKKEHVNFEGLEAEAKEIVSSNNNIGVAQITFKGDANSPALDKIITTNPETGEYKVDLIPYQYQILPNGITIPTNSAINVLTASETLDLREIAPLKTSEFTTKDNTELKSEPYNYVKSFRYNSEVVVYLLDQEFDTEFTIDNNTFDISNFNTPIYTQKEPYKITFEVVQEYVNNDESTPVTTKEFFTDGAFNITNNIAQTDTQEIVLKDNNTKYEYSFNAGLPNITLTDGFEQSIVVQYVIDGSNPLSISNIADFKNSGIVKGGRPSAGKTFVTSAPEVPEIILRDPPGTNSFATIEKGTSFKMKSTKATTDADTSEKGFLISLGPDVVFSTGILFSKETNLDIVNDLTKNVTRTTENTAENETEITYTFNQAISTSDEPDFVGADGDLFIGNAKNVFYGIFDNMFITENIPLDLNNATIPHISVDAKDKDGKVKKLYISTSKDYFIAEQPTNTFFTYSQKYVVETLIPELDNLAALGTTTTTGTNATNNRSSEFYTQQANLWRKVIQNNEKAKYDAKNNRNSVRNNIIKSATDNFQGRLQTDLTSLVNENFYSNRSFDAGLGEFKSEVTSTRLTTNTYTTSIDVDNEYRNQIGVFVNGLGGTLNYSRANREVDVTSDTAEQEITNTISYTLKDNDKSNLLSVDVVSLFDGNGPVFITRGGTTSCPYEGETTSIFFKNANFDSNVIGTGGEILSEATNRVYNAEISVERNLITNVPESDAAVFKVRLKNTSETQTDLEFILDVNPLSLNGAETNIEANGVSVFLPFNETIEFPIEISKTSSSSVFKYEDIEFLLYSPCAFTRDKDEISLKVTAEFRKSCTNVAISSPENNWVFNNNEAYALDINGNQTINKLPVTFTDFNTDFSGFQKIDLQYRNASASNWTKLASYYGSETLKTASGDAEGIVIKSSDAEFTYNWDIVGNNIPDDTYEFRAVSYCTDNVTNISEIITGIVNLNAPLVFGTPKPTDGILDVGEDVTVRFNEPIFNRTTTSISVTGLQNQQEINHDVSVFLAGNANKIELPNQRLNNQSFTLQFWFDSNTTGKGKLVSQENGMTVEIDGNHLDFILGDERISTKTKSNPLDSSQFNFYSFVYQNGADPKLIIMENGDVLEEVWLDGNIDFNTSASIFIGDTNVIGNLHDVRLWTRSFTQAQATVAKDVTLTGREINLIGYWKLDEGFGKSGLDKAKRKNAIVNPDWAIFPKGTSYTFQNNEYLTLNRVGFVQPTNFEDLTLSFWIKPNSSSAGTIFSNGKGDNSEPILTNGFRNKWSVNLTSNGNLELQAENETFNLTLKPIEKNNWTHVAITLRRGGSLNSYINGNEESSVSSAKIGGFSGNKILIGARLFVDLTRNETIDNHFTGQLDEIRFWNTARSLDQIKRDRYFEIDKETPGLLLYSDFNEDATNTSNGPAYHHKAVNLTVGTTFANLSGTNQTYSQDSPALKPQLQFTNIPFSSIINGDEMIIQPALTDQEWSLFEGEIINFSVVRLSDTHFNTQNSPVSWSALVNRQEIEWFTKDQEKEIVAQKTVGEEFTFTMDLINIGGSNQPFTITGLPTYMKAATTSGSVAPNSRRQITFTVDKELSMGNYAADIFLRTASGFNDRLTFNLRVLTDAPNWAVNPREFDFSMNIIGKIKLNNVFSRDTYTKVGAFINDEPKGEAYLTYDTAYDSYFVYLTVYNNEAVNGDVTFKIWDAINGKIIVSSIDNRAQTSFLQNEILGTNANPTLFEATTLSEQNLTLNRGWTWVSFFTNDARFNNLTSTFIDLDLSEGDAIKTQSNFVNYENSQWLGNLNALTSAEMYKVKLAKVNNLRTRGPKIFVSDFDVDIEKGWNWLPFPIHRNIDLVEALAFYDASDGDVIKDQFNFAIYDANFGWRGTLNYFESGQGYMLKSDKKQIFNYPDAQITQKIKSTKIAVQKSVNDNAQFAAYSGNMSIIAEIISDDTFDQVLVLDENNMLRGIADIIDFDNKKISFISVFSNKTETLKFVLKNSFEEITLATELLFIDNQVLGDLKNPLQLSTKALSLNNFVLNDAVLYPNPFTNEVTIDFSMYEIEISKIEIFNTIGVSIISKTDNLEDVIKINTSNLANGIYLIRITDAKGKFVIKKIVKE